MSNLNETETALVGLRVSSALSFIGSLAIIVSFIFVKKLQSTMNKIVFFMSIADLGISVTLFFGNWGVIYGWNSGLCQAQGFFIYVCFISTMAWAACMATHCLLAVLIAKPLKSFDAAIKYYNIIAWGIPLFIATIPFMLKYSLHRGDSFGPGRYYCSMTNSYSDWRLILFYAPIWLIFIYNLVVYSFVGYKIMKSFKALTQASGAVINKNDSKSLSSRNLRRYVMKTGVYLSVYVLCWTFPTVNRFHDFLNLETPFPIEFLALITAPSQGFFNACIYFYFAYYSITRKRTSLMSDTGKGTTDLENSHSAGPWTPTVSWTPYTAPVNISQQNHLEPNW